MKIGIIFLACLVLFGCNPGIEAPASQGDTFLVRIGIQDENAGSRTVQPVVSFAEVTGYELWGGKSGNPETKLASFVNIERGSVELSGGTWNFTLKALKNGAPYLTGGIQDRTIGTSDNGLSFLLIPPYTEGEGTGTVKVTIDLTAVPIKIGSALVEIDGKPGDSLTAAAGKIVYQKTGEPVGDYFVRFQFKDDAGTIVAAISELIRVRAGLVSEKTITLLGSDLNSKTIKTPQKWAAGTGVSTSARVNKVAYGKNVFVAVGQSSFAAWSDDDGETWTTVATSQFVNASQNLYTYFGEGYFIAFDEGGNNWASSTDGKTWNQITGGTVKGKGGVYGNGYYLIGGDTGKIAYTKTPAVAGSWKTSDETKTKITSTSTVTGTINSDKFINTIAYGNDIFVAGAGNGQIVWTSDPEDDWTPSNVTQNGENIFKNGIVYSIAFGNNGFIAAAPGQIAWSADGKTWTLIASLGSSTQSVCFGDGIFVAGVNPTPSPIMYSLDSGKTWTQTNTTGISISALTSIAYGDGTFVFGAGGNSSSVHLGYSKAQAIAE